MTISHAKALAELTRCMARLGTVERALRRAGCREDQINTDDPGALVDVIVAAHKMDDAHLLARVENLRWSVIRLAGDRRKVIREGQAERRHTGCETCAYRVAADKLVAQHLRDLAEHVHDADSTIELWPKLFE